MRASVRALLGLPFLAASAAASAAPVSASAGGTASVLTPLSIIKTADLDFGTIVATGAGTAVIDPVNRTLTTTGLLVPSGTRSHPAGFTATGSRNAVVLVRVPKNPITVTRVGGTETMTVGNWTLDGNINRRVPANQTFDFAVGATLNVGAGQAEGTYVGSFDVTVQYP